MATFEEEICAAERAFAGVSAVLAKFWEKSAAEGCDYLKASRVFAAIVL